MRVTLDIGAFEPLRAHDTDAGMDIRSRETKTVLAHGSEIFYTGVHVELPNGTAGILLSKSGLNVNHGITSEGLIDEGYTGQIVVKLYNNSDDDYIVNRGDKISQMVIVPVLYESIEIVDKLGESDRGADGFGSSGR